MGLPGIIAILNQLISLLLDGTEANQLHWISHAVTSPPHPCHLGRIKPNGGCSALAAETCKQLSNCPKCLELGSTCIPIIVETYGGCGTEDLSATSAVNCKPEPIRPINKR